MLPASQCSAGEKVVDLKRPATAAYVVGTEPAGAAAEEVLVKPAVRSQRHRVHAADMSRAEAEAEVEFATVAACRYPKWRSSCSSTNSPACLVAGGSAFQVARNSGWVR